MQITGSTQIGFMSKRSRYLLGLLAALVLVPVG